MHAPGFNYFIVMIKKLLTRRAILVVILILIATIGRLVSNSLHLWNFAPIGAIGLFGGMVLKNKKSAILFLLATLLCSDLCLELLTPIKGFYGWSQLFNYGAFCLIALLGTAISRINTRNVVLGSLASSLIFFLFSNLGVWIFAGGIAPYTLDPTGIGNTYLLAIPFFGNTIAGDMFYCTLFFGAWSMVRHWRPALAERIA